MATYNDGQTYNNTNYTYDGLSTTQAVTLLIGKRTDWKDFTSLLSIGSASITDAGTNARSTASFSLKTTLAAAPEITDQALVAFVTPSATPDIFRGLIRSRRPRTGLNTMLDIIADDLGGLLDDTYIPSDVRPAETAQSRITWLWQTYASPPLELDDLSSVANIGSTLPVQNFAGVTLRQAIEMTISQASSSADYYVDTMGKLHVFTSESNAAPYAVKVGTPSGSEVAPEDLDIDYDSNAYANRVYIQAATPQASGFYRNETAITAAAGMLRTAVVQAPDCETAAMAASLAAMYLGRVSSSKPRGSFSCSSPYDGWRAGQNVTVTESDMGITAQVFRIANVTTTFRGKATSFEREYEVQFGGGSAGAQGVQVEGIGSGQVVSGMLGGGGNVYVTSDGVQVTDTIRVRVYLGALPGGGYGLQVVNGADVAIIDGSSDIFRITATGTLSVPVGPNGSIGTIDQVITSIDVGTGLTYSPAYMAYVDQGTSVQMLPGESLTATGNWNDKYSGTTSLSGPSGTRFTVIWSAQTNRTASSRNFRYYILQQIAF